MDGKPAELSPDPVDGHTNQGRQPHKKRQQSEKLAKIPCSLPRLELKLILLVFAALLSYTAYKLFIVSNRYRLLQERSSHSSIQTESALFRSKPQFFHDSDLEWKQWKIDFFAHQGPFLLGHVLLARFVEHFFWEKRKYFFMVYGLTAMYFMIGPSLFLAILGHCLVMYAVSWSRNIVACWTVNIVLVGTLNFRIFTQWTKTWSASYHAYVTFFILSSITVHRYTACCIETRYRRHRSPIDLLAYTFYFPLMKYGPVMTYDVWEQEYNQPRMQWTNARISYLSKRFWRILLVVILTEVMHRYTYFNAMLRDFTFLQQADLWVLAGLSCCQGPRP